MSDILSVISLILVVVILLSFQLTPATFSIFYHYTLGRYSTKKADNLSLSFILGVEFFTAAIWLSIYFIIYAIFINLPNFSHIFLWALAGILVAEAIIFFICYFRRIKSKADRASTTLFIPRRFARALSARAKCIKTRRDAFVLGFFTGVPELFFTIPVFVTSSFLLMYSMILPRALSAIFIVVILVLPLFIIRTIFHSGGNLAVIQRLRVSLRPVIRFFTPLCLLALAATLINLGLL